jgi:hypothetical protein
MSANGCYTQLGTETMTHLVCRVLLRPRARQTERMRTAALFGALLVFVNEVHKLVPDVVVKARIVAGDREPVAVIKHRSDKNLWPSALDSLSTLAAIPRAGSSLYPGGDFSGDAACSVYSRSCSDRRGNPQKRITRLQRIRHSGTLSPCPRGLVKTVLDGDRLSEVLTF